MNAHGETWTAEKFVSDAIVDSRMCGMSDEEIAIGERALAIVRLHPELVAACLNAKLMLDRNFASEDSYGVPFNGDDEHEAYGLLTAVLARAHALGSCEKREQPTAD